MRLSKHPLHSATSASPPNFQSLSPTQPNHISHQLSSAKRVSEPGIITSRCLTGALSRLPYLTVDEHPLECVWLGGE